MQRMGISLGSKTYTIIKVPFDYLYNNKFILEDHYKEVGINNDFKLNIFTYRNLEASGKYLCVAILQDDILVGYAGILADNLIQSCEHQYAHIDAIYINKEHRTFALFVHFMRYIEALIKEYEIDYLIVSSTRKRPLDNLLKRLKYSEQERLFIKEL